MNVKGKYHIVLYILKFKNSKRVKEIIGQTPGQRYQITKKWTPTSPRSDGGQEDYDKKQDCKRQYTEHLNKTMRQNF